MSVCGRKGKNSSGFILHTQDATCKINVKNFLGRNTNIQCHVSSCLCTNFFVDLYHTIFLCIYTA